MTFAASSSPKLLYASRAPSLISIWYARIMVLKANLLKNFASKLKKLCELQVVFTTCKLRSCLPTLKLSFNRELKFHVVYEIKCNGCGSIYVGQTSRHVTTIAAARAQYLLSFVIERGTCLKYKD